MLDPGCLADSSFPFSTLTISARCLWPPECLTRNPQTLPPRTSRVRSFSPLLLSRLSPSWLLSKVRRRCVSVWVSWSSSYEEFVGPLGCLCSRRSPDLGAFSPVSSGRALPSLSPLRLPRRECWPACWCSAGPLGSVPFA